MQNNTIESSDLESPVACAQRVKYVRNLANVSRLELCEDDVININTLKGWERGRYGGLSKSGASKLVAKLAEYGVHCTSEWLLYGIGNEPKVIVNFKQVQVDLNLNDASSANFDLEKSNLNIIEELRFFHKLHTNVIDLKITDDTMYPIYKLNDIVAGIKFFGKNIHKLINQDCIVLTKNGDVLLRRIKPGSNEDLYNLVAINTDTTHNQPILCDVTLASAAAVIWHRKELPQ